MELALEQLGLALAKFRRVNRRERLTPQQASRLDPLLSSAIIPAVPNLADLTARRPSGEVRWGSRSCG